MAVSASGLGSNLTLVVPDVHVAVVQGGHHPRLLRVKVHALHSVGARQKLALRGRG